MAHWRGYEMRERDGYTWLASVKIYRHRGTWAFYANGFLWCRQWGFKSARAALLAASRWMGNGKLLREP